MIVILWLVTGGLIGWALGIARHATAPRDASVNVLVGIAGALLGGWLVSPLLGVVALHENEWSLPSLGAAALGAGIALAMAQLVRRGVDFRKP